MSSFHKWNYLSLVRWCKTNCTQLSDLKHYILLKILWIKNLVKSQLGSLTSTGMATTGIPTSKVVCSIIWQGSLCLFLHMASHSPGSIHVASVSHNLVVSEEWDSLHNSWLPLEECFKRPRWKLQAFFRPNFESLVMLFLPRYFVKVTNSSHLSGTLPVLAWIFSCSRNLHDPN